MKERQTLDVIPVEMSEENVDRKLLFILKNELHQLFPQKSNAKAGVDNDKVLVVKYLKAGCVPSKYVCGFAGRTDDTPRTPKF